MSKIFGNTYIWLFLVNSESVLFTFVLLAFVKYTLNRCTQNSIFCIFWRLETLVLWQKTFENLFIFVYLLCPKKSTIDTRKISLTREKLIVEGCPTLHWIAFLMLYQLVHNIPSHLNQLILAWSACIEYAGVVDLISSQLVRFFVIASLNPWFFAYKHLYYVFDKYGLLCMTAL